MTPVAESALPDPLTEGNPPQPRARVELGSDLEEPTHAYLFPGPPGSGKAAAARPAPPSYCRAPSTPRMPGARP